MNASHQMKYEVERLEAKAVSLHKRMAEDNVTAVEMQEVREELTFVLERLKLAQHNAANWSTMTAPVEVVKPGAPPRQPEDELSPALDAAILASQKQAKALTRAAAGAGQSLGQKLLHDFRRNLGPTLKDQLEGQDSPFQPPTLLSKSLEKTLRQHLASEKRALDEQNVPEEDRPSVPQALGGALVALLRELTVGARRDIPKGGIERIQQTAALNSAVEAGNLFQKSLWQAEAQAGRKVSLRMGKDGGEEVEIAVTILTSFDDLKETACAYWRIVPKRYIISDQYGVQFLGHMGVLEGLQLSPAGSQLELNPLYNVERAAKIAEKGQEVEEERGIDIAKLIAEKNMPKEKVKTGDDEEDDDDDDDEENISVKTFGFGDGKMTRCQMLTGVVQTTILLMLLYLSAVVRLNRRDEKRLCSSLENAFADKIFTEKKAEGLAGALLSFRTLSSYEQFGQWLREVFPDVLFGVSANASSAYAGNPPRNIDGPAIVSGHTSLLGGLRLLQKRSETAEQDRCSPAPIMTSEDKYPHSIFTSMVDPSIVSKTIDRDIDIDDDKNLSASISDALMLLDYGNISYCYYNRPDQTPYGPMASNVSKDSQIYKYFAEFKMPSHACIPECNLAGNPGLIDAFVYHTGPELGRPYSLHSKSLLPGGFAVTLPGNVTRRNWDKLMEKRLDGVWLDRKTRVVDIDMHLFNAQLDFVVSLQLQTNLEISGRVKTKAACVAISMSEFSYSKAVPEFLCLLWMLARLLTIATRLCKKRKPEAGQRPVRCVITIELVVNLVTFSMGLYATYVRVLYLIEKSHAEQPFKEGMPWPPPYSGSVGTLVGLLRNSCTLYAWALLTCTLRYALYYSIISQKLYILRLTISRALVRLIPSLFFVIMTLVAFAVGGNQLYAPTTSQWSSPISSIGTTLYLLRRPFGMPWKGMIQNSLIWPIDSEEPSPVMLTFLLGFTCTTIWVMANLYKAVIIIEYSTVVREYNGKQPGDLKDDPWPSFSLLKLFKRQKARFNQYRFNQRMGSHRGKKLKETLEEQKKKQKKFMIEAKGGKAKKSKKSGDEEGEDDEGGDGKKKKKKKRKTKGSADEEEAAAVSATADGDDAT